MRADPSGDPTPPAPPPPPPPPPDPPVAYQPPPASAQPGAQPNTTGDPNAYGYPTTTTDPYTTAGGTAVAAGGLAPTQTVLPDGTTITTFPDGSMWTWYPDGTLNTTTPNPNGTISTTTTLPDGKIGGTTTTAWGPDGTATTTTTGGGAAHTSTGTGGGDDGSPSNPVDWRSYLANWGFPPDVVENIDAIFRKYDANHVGDAQAAALAYIRGTDWYKGMFPGIDQGIKLGLFADEQGYRQYVNDITGLTQTALGRAPTTDEITGYINRGWSAARVGNYFQAQGFLAADKGLVPDGMFTDDELAKIADVQAGVGGAEGQNLFNLFSYAQGANPVFLRHFGRNATRAELESYQKSGTTPEVLDKHFTGQEVVQAQRPELNYVTGAFGIGDTSQETDQALAAYGDQTQGLSTLMGAQVADRVDKARQRLAAIVQGTLAQPNLGLFGGKRVASGFGRNLNAPDVGA